MLTMLCPVITSLPSVNSWKGRMQPLFTSSEFKAALPPVGMFWMTKLGANLLRSNRNITKTQIMPPSFEAYQVDLELLHFFKS